ncbi:MAG: hypothetical protein DMF66_04535, partial [Acidobacteria bacterium]
MRACALHLFQQLRRFGLRLLVRCRRALALARQPFGLRRKLLDRGFELAASLGQTLGDSRVRQQLAARALDG